MKKKIIIAFLTALSYSNFCNFLFAQCNWTSQNSGVNTPLNAVFFITDEIGYVVGNSGVILKTINGGNTWESQTTNTNAHLYSVFFKDANNGYAVGEQGTILRTTNGGTSWINVSESTKRLKSVSFKSTSEGIIGGQDGKILKTVDGGNTWVSKNSLTTKDLESVKYADANTVYAVGDKGTVIKSTDAGDSWLVKSSGSNEIYRSTSFADANEGFIAGEGNTSVMKKTVNGGNTWLPLNVANNVKLTSVFFLNKNEGYAVGLTGTILKTIDGGANWNPMTSGTNKNLMSVYFASSTTGYTVGNNGTILKYKCGAIPQGLSSDEFVLGTFGLHYEYSKDGSGIIITDKKIGSNYSSTLGVLADDGFAVVQTYHPDNWISIPNYTNIIQLTKNNGLKILVNEMRYFKPNATGAGGINQYDISQYYSGAYSNYDILYNNIYSNAEYSNVIWGHQMTEEASYKHGYAFKDVVPPHYCDTCNDAYYKTAEVPPQNVSDAINYFQAKKNALNIPDQKLVVMEAIHGGFLSDAFDDGDGIYNPQDYLTMSNVQGPNKPDVFFEGSYFWTQFKDWLTQSSSNSNYYYLGKFKSIDYAKTKVANVHSVISVEHNSTPEWNYVFHSNPNIPNANQLWFQTYTSIIHGAKGVWFWETTGMWNDDEPEDAINRTYSGADKFQFSHFPIYYQRFLSNLVKELRYLVNTGLLSNNPNSIIYSKTRQWDENCILLPASSYLPKIIAPGDARDLNAINNSAGPIINIHFDEEYGLRYTIRTNGSDVIMIVSNPNPYSVHNVPFNFNNVSNPVIRNSTGVDVLFNSGAIKNVNSSLYKVETATIHNRSNSVDINSNTILKKYSISFNNYKSFSDDFGPFDTKVYQFTTTVNTPNYNNDWAKVWSNNGNKGIGGWNPIRPTDKFIIGDFDGDGLDELLTLQGGQNYNWAVMQRFNENTSNWDWLWSNYGDNHLASDWPLDPSHRYFVGDFTGDNKAELLCISGMNGYANMYSYNNGTWNNWIWQNQNTAGLGKLATDWPLDASHRYFVGDFTGDSKDELLCISGTNGFANMYRLANGNWDNWVWQNQYTVGIGKLATDWPLAASHRYFVGDFDGNSDNKDEILCVSGTNTYTNIYKFNNGWHWFWSNSLPPDNLNAIAGWALPFKPSDKILVGNIDGDAKAELMLIQRGSTAVWAQTKDVESTNNKLTWRWSNTSALPYIYDWPISGGNNTDYFLLKVSPDNPKYLLSIRDFRSNASCSNNYIANIYKTNNPNVNYKLTSESYLSEIENQDSILLSKKTTEWDIYPNPNNGLFEINLTTTIEISDFEIGIYNTIGQLLKKISYEYPDGVLNQKIDIDLKDLQPGVYFIKLSFNDKEEIRRLSIVK